VLLLASERDVKGYQRLSGWVDGDAYYWSSVNPDTFVGYQEKLDELSQAVHASGGLWIAPASVGFDARLIGGSTVVGRGGGANLRRQFSAALSSSPDAIGLISWNEFSENSHTEPSMLYGSSSLDALAELRHLPPLNVPTDSSEATSSSGAVADDLSGLSRAAALAAVGLLLVAGLYFSVHRARRRTTLPVDRG
jgi:hypothetical protein